MLERRRSVGNAHDTSEIRGACYATPQHRSGIIDSMAPRPANPPAETALDQAEVASSNEAARFRFSLGVRPAIDRCWRKAAAPAGWNLTRERFEKALARSVAHRFGDTTPNDKAIGAYLETLNAADLALACACSDGSPAAWDHFVAQFRPELYRAARAVAGDANSRELADSLYADLYGLRESEGYRKSLLDYFHGRSKLGTWLRAVLSQRYVDEIRRVRRTESLEDESGQQRHEIAAVAQAARDPANAAPDPAREPYLAALQAALGSALGALEPRDRLRLAYYYADDRTLAEIGRLLGEHEATVSRKLDRTRREVRRLVESSLRSEKKWTEAQVRLCLEYTQGEWPFDLTEALRSPGSRLPTAAQPDTVSGRD